MKLLNLLWGAAEYAVILPGALMCLAPAKNWFLIPTRRMYPTTLCVLAVLCLLGGYLELYDFRYGNLLVFAMLALLLSVYFFAVQLDKWKLLFIFSGVTAILAFGGLANHLVECVVVPDGHSEEGYSSWGLAFQWLYSLSALALCKLLFYKKLVWMLSNFHSRIVWCFTSLLNLLIVVCNYLLIPRNYATMAVGRVLPLTWMMWVVFLLLYLLFTELFFYTSHSLIQKSEIEKKTQLAQMQQSQYASMQRYLQQTEQVRHDFRHTLRTISELLNENEYEELQKFLNAYLDSPILRQRQTLYCKQPVVNALLQYYAAMAEDAAVKLHWEVKLPQVLHASDVDLCVILGNLLENAIQGCGAVEPPQRTLRLSVDVEESELYIVVINSCSDKVRMKDGRFLSTKKDGSGIGLISVSAIAEKYAGAVDFHTKNQHFYSNVMLKLPAQASGDALG